jgi:hypothetical protein
MEYGEQCGFSDLKSILTKINEVVAKINIS